MQLSSEGQYSLQSAGFDPAGGGRLSPDMGHDLPIRSANPSVEYAIAEGTEQLHTAWMNWADEHFSSDEDIAFPKHYLGAQSSDATASSSSSPNPSVLPMACPAHAPNLPFPPGIMSLSPPSSSNLILNPDAEVFVPMGLVDFSSPPVIPVLPDSVRFSQSPNTRCPDKGGTRYPDKGGISSRCPDKGGIDYSDKDGLLELPEYTVSLSSSDPFGLQLEKLIPERSCTSLPQPVEVVSAASSTAKGSKPQLSCRATRHSDKDGIGRRSDKDGIGDFSVSDVVAGTIHDGADPMADVLPGGVISCYPLLLQVVPKSISQLSRVQLTLETMEGIQLAHLVLRLYLTSRLSTETIRKTNDPYMTIFWHIGPTCPKCLPHEWCRGCALSFGAENVFQMVGRAIQYRKRISSTLIKYLPWWSLNSPEVLRSDDLGELIPERFTDRCNICHLHPMFAFMRP